MSAETSCYLCANDPLSPKLGSRVVSHQHSSLFADILFVFLVLFLGHDSCNSILIHRVQRSLVVPCGFGLVVITYLFIFLLYRRCHCTWINSLLSILCWSSKMFMTIVFYQMGGACFLNFILSQYRSPLLIKGADEAVICAGCDHVPWPGSRSHSGKRGWGQRAGPWGAMCQTLRKTLCCFRALQAAGIKRCRD